MVSFRKGDVLQARALLQRTRAAFEQAGIKPGRDDEIEIDWLGQELAKVGR
jgi:hypothetical protein